MPHRGRTRHRRRADRGGAPPPNHPGALADSGAENDRYAVVAVERGRDLVAATLRNVEPASALRGTRKSFVLGADATLIACYRPPSSGLAIEACLSPDYLNLLREGREGLRASGDEEHRGWTNGGISGWLAIPEREALEWEEPAQPEVGHGLNFRLRARSAHVHVALGTGAYDRDAVRRLSLDAHETLHAREGTRGWCGGRPSW